MIITTLEVLSILELAGLVALIAACLLPWRIKQ